MGKREIKEYHAREIKEYHVRVRDRVRFMSLRSPFRIETAVLLFHLKEQSIVSAVISAGKRFELGRSDYKMISAPEKCATTVAHPSAPQVPQ